VTKRCIDVVVSIVALLVTLPFFLAIAVAIKLDSPGPVLFRQRRNGFNQREFRVFKFRTMSTLDDGDVIPQATRGQKAAWEAAFKLTNDARITRVGRWLRRRSLDELPQLINVLRGEMSLVGPRPVVEDELRRFGHGAALILRAAPGITGLWAVSGRSDISYDERVELECRYVTEWSLWLDLSILLRTVPVVFRGSGSY
jgi:lipopolysaccharide/colanic/teichoic acid biosynthesis glycosyltransferase